MVKNLSLLTGSVFVTLIAFELLARAFYAPAPTKIAAFSRSPSGYYRSDHELGWLPRVNQRGVHDKKGSFFSTFTTNSRGLRAREYPPEKPHGVTRIVVLGDSFTWGFGVNDDEIYPLRLEGLLANTEVINLGVTAYGLAQEVGYFQREGVLYDPDVLIVAVAMNDLYSKKDFEAQKAKVLEGRRTDQGHDATMVGPEQRIKRVLRNSSVLYRFVVHRVNTNKRLVKILVSLGVKGPLGGFDQLDSNLAPALRIYPEVLESSFRSAKSRLLQLKNLSSDLGIEFIIAIVPSLQSVNKTAFEHTIAHSRFEASDFDLDKPYRLLREFAEAEHIEVVSPVEEFRRAHAEGTRMYLPRDMHFSAAGHELFAHAISAHLKEKFF